MKKAESFLAVPMSEKEKTLLERVSKRSRIGSGELVRMLLFETGILAASDGARTSGSVPVP